MRVRWLVVNGWINFCPRTTLESYTMSERVVAGWLRNRSRGLYRRKGIDSLFTGRKEDLGARGDLGLG